MATTQTFSTQLSRPPSKTQRWVMLVAADWLGLNESAVICKPVCLQAFAVSSHQAVIVWRQVASHLVTCAVTVGSGWLCCMISLLETSWLQYFKVWHQKTFCISGSTDYYLFIHFIPIYVCLLAYLFIGFLVATSLKLGKLHPSVSEP